MESRNTQTASSQQAVGDNFHVPTWMHLFGGWVARHPSFWIKLGNLETRLVEESISEISIDRPIFIAGLARSGTTILLELLAEHPQVATHQYRDFPALLTPYWWNRWLDLVPQREEKAEERAHGDGIAVTSRSPEAFEEMLWMAFFPQLHDPMRNSLLDKHASYPGFERFHAEHIRKLLRVRNRQRYAAKGNYNLTRLAYLQRLYSDARFILPIRDPTWHIASLMKQQALFTAGESQSSRALDHMRRVGHFEFGLDRRAINTGNDELTAEVTQLWANGEEIEGWARYWAYIYDSVADTLDADPQLSQACMVIRYEELCQQPNEMLTRFYEHCSLEITQADLQQAASRLHFPGYYRPAFSDQELALIERITSPVARRFGYESLATNNLNDDP